MCIKKWMYPCEHLTVVKYWDGCQCRNITITSMSICCGKCFEGPTGLAPKGKTALELMVVKLSNEEAFSEHSDSEESPQEVSYFEKATDQNTASSCCPITVIEEDRDATALDTDGSSLCTDIANMLCITTPEKQLASLATTDENSCDLRQLASNTPPGEKSPIPGLKPLKSALKNSPTKTNEEVLSQAFAAADISETTKTSTMSEKLLAALSGTGYFGRKLPGIGNEQEQSYYHEKAKLAKRLREEQTGILECDESYDPDDVEQLMRFPGRYNKDSLGRVVSFKCPDEFGELELEPKWDFGSESEDGTEYSSTFEFV